MTSTEQTSREYPLPHPENIAVEDVVRIRTAVEKIDEDMNERENEHKNLKKAFERVRFETSLNLWSSK